MNRNVEQERREQEGDESSSHTLTHTHSHTLTHTLTHSHTHTLTHTLTHTHSLSSPPHTQAKAHKRRSHNEKSQPSLKHRPSCPDRPAPKYIVLSSMPTATCPKRGEGNTPEAGLRSRRCQNSSGSPLMSWFRVVATVRTVAVMGSTTACNARSSMSSSLPGRRAQMERTSEPLKPPETTRASLMVAMLPHARAVSVRR